MTSARLTEEELARIDELVVISCRLPDVTDSREVRLYIDLELVLLFRLASDALGSGDPGPEVPPGAMTLAVPGEAADTVGGVPARGLWV